MCIRDSSIHFSPHLTHIITPSMVNPDGHQDNETPPSLVAGTVDRAHSSGTSPRTWLRVGARGTPANKRSDDPSWHMSVASPPQIVQRRFVRPYISPPRALARRNSEGSAHPEDAGPPGRNHHLSPENTPPLPTQLTTSASVHPLPRPCTQAQAPRFINPSSIG